MNTPDSRNQVEKKKKKRGSESCPGVGPKKLTCCNLEHLAVVPTVCQAGPVVLTLGISSALALATSQAPDLSA